MLEHGQLSQARPQLVLVGLQPMAVLPSYSRKRERQVAPWLTALLFPHGSALPLEGLIAHHPIPKGQGWLPRHSCVGSTSCGLQNLPPQGPRLMGPHHSYRVSCLGASNYTPPLGQISLGLMLLPPAPLQGSQSPLPLSQAQSSISSPAGSVIPCCTVPPLLSQGHVRIRP